MVALANHLPLVQRVQGLRIAGTVKTIGDLARLDEADWAKLLREADPDAEQIAPQASTADETRAAARLRPADRSARGATLAARFENRYPTMALAGRLARALGGVDPPARGDAGCAAVPRPRALVLRAAYPHRPLRRRPPDRRVRRRRRPGAAPLISRRCSARQADPAVADVKA